MVREFSPCSIQGTCHRYYVAHIKGSLQIGDETIQLEGNGLRDHSWGPRYWQETVSYRFINGAFGDDLGFGFTSTAKGAGGNLQVGKDMYAAVTDVKIATKYTNDDSGKEWPGVERPATVYQNHKEFVMTVKAEKEGVCHFVCQGCVSLC